MLLPLTLFFRGWTTKTKCNPLIIKTALSFCCNLLSLRGCYYETPKPLLYLGEQSQRVLTHFKLTMSSSSSSRTQVKSLLLKDSSHYCLFYRRIESYGCRGGIRTHDRRLMKTLSYHCSTLRYKLRTLGVEPSISWI